MSRDQAPTTIALVLQQAIQRLEFAPALKQVAIAARLEAELLLTDASGWNRSTLRAWPEREIPTPVLIQFQTLLQRRLEGEPIAYIRGRQDFWTFTLNVSPATLIPRPETELLVETVLASEFQSTHPMIADLGTGSGAIAAALAMERPDWQLIAVDRSLAALEIAQRNFRALKLSRICCLCASWLSALKPQLLDAIVSNPPYIALEDPHLAHGDLRFEPSTALVSGQDGLDDIRLLAKLGPSYLKPNGLLLLEHGYNQASAIQQILRELGYTAIKTYQDLNGLDRITYARR